MKYLLSFILLVALGFGVQAQSVEGDYSGESSTMTLDVADQMVKGTITIDGVTFMLDGKLDGNIAQVVIMTADKQRLAHAEISPSNGGALIQIAHTEADAELPSELQMSRAE